MLNARLCTSLVGILVKHAVSASYVQSPEATTIYATPGTSNGNGLQL